jgi:hypothetical protein
MFRKFMLTAVVGAIAPGSIDQTISALMISTAFLVYHLKYQPFLNDEEDNIQSASFTTIVITLAIGISLEAGGTNNFKTSLLVFVNVGTVAFCLVQTAIFMYNSFADVAKAKLREFGVLKDPNQNDDSASCVEYEGLDEHETMAKGTDDHKTMAKSTDDHKTMAKSTDNHKTMAKSTDDHKTMPESSDNHKHDHGKMGCIKAVVVEPDLEQGMKEDNEVCTKANDKVCDDDRHIMEEVDKCVAEAFKRFDFDGSGTINSHDELQMLTMHVLFKMDHTNAKYSQQAALDSVDAFAEAGMEGGWTPEEYSKWFKEQIVKG